MKIIIITKLLIKSLIIGTAIWCVGALITFWAGNIVTGILWYIAGGYSVMGLSSLEAILYFVRGIFEALFGMPFYLAIAIRWGILRYWYIGGFTSALYLFACSWRKRPFPILLVVLFIMQIIIYTTTNHPIDYRRITLYEHIAYYIIPMIGGTLLTYYYAKRTMSQ